MRSKKLLLVAALLAGCVALSAQNLVVSLVSPGRPLAPEAPVKLDLLAVNPSLTEAIFDPPAALHGVLLAGGKSWPVELVSTPTDPAPVQPGAFASRGYTLVVPAGAKGRVVLEITEGDYAPLRGVLLISADQAVGTAPAETSPRSTLDAATPELAHVQRNFLGHFSAHEPIYFIYGDKEPGAKFQFSFKYRLIDFSSDATANFQRTLEFGYSQRSLWDITGNSSPFYDTSYMPSFFYESLAAQGGGSRGGMLTWIGYQVGYQHESNGQGLTGSRSLNTLFVRPEFILGSPEDWHVIVVPKIWAYVGDLSNNEQLKDYRGYGELLLIFGRGGGMALAYTGRAGQDFNHITTQLDLTVPIRIKLLDFASYFLVQYFDGYGESLRDYNRKSTALRAGISLVR